MTVPPQSVYEAMASYIEQMVPACGPAAVYESRSGALLAISTIPLPFANGVWIVEPDADATTVSDMVRRVADSGLPFLLVGRDERRDEWAELAEGAGLVFAEDTPLMLLDDLSALPVSTTPDLQIRNVPGELFDQHSRMAADAFEVPLEMYAQLMTVCGSLAGLRVYVADIDGEPVTTAVSMRTSGSSVGVFSVATPADFRGRGLGHAITVHAIAEAAKDGAQWAWLQSSEAGFHVYERMGFRTVGIQPMWVGNGS